MGSLLQLGSAWMLTVFIISFVTLGGAHTIPQGQDLHRGGVHTIQQNQDLYRGGATKSQFENKHRPLNENDAETQYEYLQFKGTLLNFSTKQIGGTGSLSWGKWMSGGSPKFPLNAPGYMEWKSQGRENSPSGTTGTLTLYDVNGNGEDEVKVKFDCPYIGSNKCSFEGEIPGLTFERQSFSGSSGSIATCTILIKNA